MGKTSSADENITHKGSSILADKKAKYEELKGQERKRKFTILSGHIEPIQTTFHLKAEEHAYFQIKADRMAEKDHIESHTTGDARSPFIKGGILRGNTKISTTTTHERINEYVRIDSGMFLFTNLRVLFIGKQVVEILYADILSATFINSSIIIKYPGMANNETYETDTKSDAELYYHGVMRLLKHDKSSITEAEVNMDDYPKFAFGMERGLQNLFTKKLFIYPVVVILLCIIIGIMNSSSSDNNTKKVSNNAQVVKHIVYPTKKPALPTLTTAQQENAALATYIAQESKAIVSFQAEDKILDKYLPTSAIYDYGDDPIYTNMQEKYGDLESQAIDPTLPGGTGEYEEIIMDATGLMVDSMDDLCWPNRFDQDYPHVADIQIAITRVERDMEIAKNAISTDPTSSDATAVENDFDSDHFDGYNSETDVLTELDKNVTAPDPN
jgi:hypothetical protein